MREIHGGTCRCQFVGRTIVSSQMDTSLWGILPWIPKPIDAGGIGPAIKSAGTVAGKDAVQTIQQDDVTENGLWKYNKEFVEEYGYKTAGLEVFRRMLQDLTMIKLIMA